MKDHSKVLENLKAIVKEEIKDCKKYNTALYKEMETARAHKYNQIGRLLDTVKINNKHRDAYEQILEILNNIKF